MSFIDNYTDKLKNTVNIIEIFTYTISLLIIVISLVYSVFIFVKEINNISLAYNDVRLALGESISLALTFILAIEILKIFYVKTYKQLIIVVTLTLLKLVITYFLMIEIKEIQKK
jgi:hypothetical protein